jgi:hypothetical protein
LVRAFIVLFPLTILIAFLRDAMKSSLLFLSLATLALFLWGERLVNARDRFPVPLRLWLLAACVGALGALFVFAASVGRWSYGLVPGTDVNPNQIAAIRCIAAVSLSHLLWAAWRSWDTFRPEPTVGNEHRGA